MPKIQIKSPTPDDASIYKDPWSRHKHDKRRIVRPSELPSILGISRTTCWRLGRDPNSGFPKRVRLTHSGSAVGYFYDELMEYLENCQRLEA